MKGFGVFRISYVKFLTLSAESAAQRSGYRFERGKNVYCLNQRKSRRQEWLWESIGAENGLFLELLEGDKIIYMRSTPQLGNRLCAGENFKKKFKCNLNNLLDPNYWRWSSATLIGGGHYSCFLTLEFNFFYVCLNSLNKLAVFEELMDAIMEAFGEITQWPQKEKSSEILALLNFFFLWFWKFYIFWICVNFFYRT